MPVQQHQETGGHRRSRLYRLNGIVLRRRNLGESDRILTIFTREIGKHRCVAKGSRRPGSKLAGHTEPYMIVSMLMARGRNLDILSQAEALQTFPRLRQDERSIAAAGLMAERIDTLTAEGQAQPNVFQLFETALALLDRGERPEQVLLMFDMGLLRETGYRPDLVTCVGCGATIEPERNGFRFEAGGVVCPKCLRSSGHVRPVSLDVLKVLRLIDRGEIGRFLALRVPGSVLREAAELLSDYVAWISGRDSSASRVIRELRLEYQYRDMEDESEDERGLSRRSAGS